MASSPISFKTDTTGFEDMLADIEADTQSKMQMLLDAVGAETVAYLRSLTSKMQPPARRYPGGPLGGDRQAHPGGWADRSSNLANAYAYNVQVDAESATLQISNAMEYAIYLEVKENYYVIRGVFQEDGPVFAAIRRNLARIAPDWTEFRD